ncbi:MAG: hypothetical protein DCF28_11835 [Alphaproteobacteria bacterium]|nr:MAG: hypothetical protein DCF28_11835 [Alphaproteobacteria bacterium]PZO34373.1 MAG: hypothetical protein DCE92_11865 [Alphaproteobacteria bacterium]
MNPQSSKTRAFRPLLIAVAASVTLAACATATPYQPAGFNGQRGGYAEQRLESDRYRVTFAGNSVTSREQVEMGLLLRAAELTTESGYDWFSTVQRQTDRDVRYQAIPDPTFDRYSPFWGPSWRYYHRGAWGPWGFGGGRFGTGFGRDFDVREVDRFEASAEIVMGRGSKPGNDVNAFDAREVIQNVAPRLARPM